MAAKDKAVLHLPVCVVSLAPDGVQSLEALLAGLAAVDNLCLVLVGDLQGAGLPETWTVRALGADFEPEPRTILIASDVPATVFDDIATRFGSRTFGVQIGTQARDGTLIGVHEAGGMTLAEGVGGSESQGVDLAGPPEVLADTIAAFCRRMDDRSARIAPLNKQEIREVCEVLRTATGHDFKHYKDSTLSRRILRRLHVRRCDGFDDYLDLLKSDSDEARALMRDLLIGVTAFFRDTEAFDTLDAKVLDRLFSPEGPALVRIWVAGCSTGQEAYSLAMRIDERLDATGRRQEVQIFATDLDERALSVARRGVYSAAVAEQVGEARLKRYFTRTGKRYQVTKDLRQMIVFSPHNLIADPPYSRMDLIACRNVMIYLGQHLQKKLMSVFHYALRDSGFLFLGASEAVTGHGDLFRVIDSRARIAQRKDSGARGSDARRAPPGAAVAWQTFAGAPSENVAAISQRIVLDEFAPPYLVVAEDGQITYASGGTDPFLQLPEGQYVNNLMRVVRTGIRTGVRSAWTQALKTRRKADHEGLTVGAEGERRRTRIVVQPMPELGADTGTYMVVFQDLGAVASGEAWSANAADNEQLFAELEAELFQAREELEHSVQDLEAANEELKSSNEELLSMNEELQSANEELESSKEEVERANSALEDANTDLMNLLRSTQIATIFLDRAGNLRRFTPMAAHFYNITEADIGRPLAHFTHRFADPMAMPSAAELESLDDAFETEATREDGHVFLRRVTPYRADDGRLSGTVVTFVDISDAKAAQADIQASGERLRLIADNAPVLLAQLDADERYTFVNSGYAALLGKAGDEIVGRSALDVLGPDAHAQARPYLARALAGEAVEYDMDFAGPGACVRHLTVNYAPEYDADGKVVGLIAVLADITARKRAEQALAASEARFRASQQASPDGFVMMRAERSKNGAIADFIYDYANDAALRLTGKDRDTLLGATMLSLFPGLREDGLVERYAEVVETGTPLTYEMYYTRDGYDMWSGNTVVKVGDGIAVRFADITTRKHQEQQIAESAARLRRILDSVVAFVGSLTPDGILQEANQPALDAAGISRDDVIGKPFWDAYWWAHDPAVQEQLKQAIARAARGEPSRYDVKIRAADGAFIHIDFQLMPVTDGDGNVVELIPSGVDINDRLLAEDALRDSAARLQRTLDGISTMVGLLDPNGILTEVNATATAATDAEPTDVLGRYFPDTPWWSISADLRDRVAAMIREAADGRRVRDDLPWLARGGEIRWVDISMVPVRDGAGRVVAIIASGSDITERRAAQQALEDSRERLRLATRAALLGTFDLDADSGKVHWDARAVEILGLDRSATTFRAFLAMVHQDDRGLVLGDVRQGLDSGKAEQLKSAEYRVRRPDGTEIWVEGHASFPAGEPARVVGTIQNVTARKRAEQHQKLLLGELNHRVKNSLATIQAMASHTLRHASSPEAFRDAFTGRLRAIAAAHDILVGNERGGGDLMQLIRSQVGPYADLDAGNVVLDGPAVTLDPTVAHALGLILHELTTNASKYGALSVKDGVLAVNWTLATRAGRRWVDLIWTETGGPPVKEPERRGFGSRLIEKTLAHTLDGHADMTYAADGFRAVLRTPVVAKNDT